MRAIIIDDMALARESLKADLKDYCPHIEVVAEADGVVEGAKVLRKVDCDLIFLDIHMDDGEGFDILDILPELKTRVIFTTASSEHAMKAFQYAAIDYLLKPIDPELLTAAVDKVKDNPHFNSSQNEVLQSQKNDRLVLNVAEELRVVAIKEIKRCQSMGNYTQFFFEDNTKLLVTRTLKEFDLALTAKGFVRVHQSHLVNLDYVGSYIKTEGGYIRMKDGTDVPVSVRKKPAVMEAIKSLMD